MNNMTLPYSDPYMSRLSQNTLPMNDPSRSLKPKVPQHLLGSPESPSMGAYHGPEIINGSASGLAMFPRSASEAAFDSGTKYRQLPCRTFISVGTCPYRERCVYLHDPRCICRDAKTKTRRKNKDDIVLDSMFWPIMPYSAVSVKLDNNRQPHVIQPYNVPPQQPDQFRRHDEAVYSMWMHFVDFCLANNESLHVPYPDLAPCFAAPDLPINAYTKLPRLPVFRVMSSSNRHEIRREDLVAAEMGKPEISSQVDFNAKAILRKISSGTFVPPIPQAEPHMDAAYLPKPGVAAGGVALSNFAPIRQQYDSRQQGQISRSSNTTEQTSPSMPLSSAQVLGEFIDDCSESNDSLDRYDNFNNASRRSSLNDVIDITGYPDFARIEGAKMDSNYKPHLNGDSNAKALRFSPDSPSLLWGHHQ